jgi:HD-like signal output (HDOD) protein
MNVETGTADPMEVVANAINEISHIATLPEVTLKIVELVEDPTSTAQDLHNVISNDPALCSRILKVVNSSFYGLPGQIGSINRAIVLLGLNAVKNIAISASLAKLFRSGQLCPSFSAKDLWMHSVGTAAASKLVADTLSFGAPDEAFLAGLLHDIGIMVELQYDRNKLIDAVNAVEIQDGAPSKELLEVEMEVFGANHQHFGMGLCEKWKFPASFSSVCGHHHDPMALPSGARSLACLVHVADRLAAGVEDGKGFRLDLPSLEIDQGAMDEIGMTPEKLEIIKGRLAEEIEDVESLLS